ncbi:MAG: hypothetical protein ACSHW7_02265 [Patiriisocius sp.]|uniref:hypothetical protein n=1 Tax=Patiriisocius sp. TaxID=2822396 RepID=UPI003EF53FCD
MNTTIETINTRERITLSNNEDHWVCIYNIHTMDIGFATYDADGNFLEPFQGSWSGLYACQSCGRIIEQETYKAVGKNTRFKSYHSTLNTVSNTK